MRRLLGTLRRRKPVPLVADTAGEDLPSGATCASAHRTISSPHPHLCAITDVGRVRDHNEDAFHVSPDCTWFVVADGMGGHEAGEVAAALAIQAIVEHVTPERLATSAAAGDIGSLLMDAVTAAHDRVREASRSQEGGKEMGCTLAVACIGEELVTCHVGDMRCYIQRGDVLYQITRDHSTVGALVEAGQLTPEEARVHPNKNEVLQAIGMPTGVFPDVNSSGLGAGDRVLMCSDGLWEALSHNVIESILASDGSTRQRATQLVDRANHAGGHDNITAILCEVLPPIRKVDSAENEKGDVNDELAKKAEQHPERQETAD